MKKNIFNRILSMALALALCLPFCIPVSAEYNNTVSKDTHFEGNRIEVLLGKVSQDTIDTLQNAVLAYTTDEYGNEVPVQASVSISKMPMLRASSNMCAEKIYLVTVAASVQKEKEGNGHHKDKLCDCTGRITMTWTDGPGGHNTIDYLSGNVSFEKGEFYSATVFWGASHNAYGQKSKDVSTAFSFAPDPVYENNTLHAHYKIWAKDGNFSKLVLTVCAAPLY